MSEELSSQPSRDEIESFIYSKILTHSTNPFKEFQTRVGGGIEKDKLERQGGFVTSEKIVELVKIASWVISLLFTLPGWEGKPRLS